MQKRWLLGFMVAMLALAPLFGCDSDSINTDPTDGDTPDGDGPDGDTPDGDLPDGDVVGTCSDFCIPSKGFYCDEATQTCRKVRCYACADDFPGYYCGEAATCTVLNDANNRGQFCLPAAVNGKCPDGYSAKLGICHPKAACTSKLPAAKPGDPCEFGPLFPGQSCASGDSCVGIPDLGESCVDNADCEEIGRRYSNLREENMYCGGGRCGFSMCVTPCTFEGRCPEIYGLDGMRLYPDQISGTCYCGPDPLFAPVGNEEIGALCNPGRETQLEMCKSIYECLGGSARSSSCETAADCTGANDFGPNTYCSNAGYCAYSFCAGSCENNRCPEEGTNFVANQSRCYCAPEPYGMPVGTAQLGQTCNVGSEADLPYCQAGLHCRRNTDGNSTACTSVGDCPSTTFGPNAYCGSNGFCAYSVCSQPCNADNTCPSGMEPLRNTTGALCLCAPAPYGGDAPFEK